MQATALSLVKLLAATVCAVVIALMGAGGASAATFIVTAFDDVDDGACEQSHCSLREAIVASNAETGPDRILVNDDEPITPATPLPWISDTVYLRSFADGRCANDSAPLILDGGGANFTGLMFSSGSDGSHICGINVRGFSHGIQFISGENAIRQSVIGTTLDGQTADPNSVAGIVVAGEGNLIGGERGIRSNLISGNGLYGVLVHGATAARIEGNLIGTDWSSTEAVPNEVGIYVDVSSDTTIGGTPEQGNVISGNTHTGVLAGDGRIVGNRIGTDEGGTEPVPNGDAGVYAFEPVQIGGPFPQERNVISGNGRADVVLAAAARVEGNWIGPAADGSTLDDPLGIGVELIDGANGAVIGSEDAGNVIAGQQVAVLADAPLSGIEIQGNVVGLAPDGTTPMTTTDGIWLGPDTSGAQVGGPLPGMGNTVAAHDVYGVRVFGDRTRIEGNTIGLDTAGDEAGNFGGVYVANTAEGTEIGGEADGAGNTISGNEVGIQLAHGSAATAVEGNRIGLTADGVTAAGNAGAGIQIDGTADASIAGNRIAHNDGDGVRAAAAASAFLTANAIFANGTGDMGELGIDLLDDGVSANDPGDGLPDFPVLTGVDASASGATVTGLVEAPPGRELRIELFATATCDESGHGQGETVAGAVTVTAGTGPTEFSAHVATVPAGDFVTATATDLTTNRTSEFSACGPQAGPPAPPPPPDDPPSGGGRPAPPAGGPGTPAPQDPAAKLKVCRPPNVTGLTLAKAKKRIKRAGCKVGKVTRPRGRARNGHRLVVKSASRKPGSIHAAGTTMRLTLKWQRVKQRER